MNSLCQSHGWSCHSYTNDLDVEKKTEMEMSKKKKNKNKEII